MGQNGTILRTTNGGANWTQQSSGTNNTLRSVFFPAVDTGYTVGLSGTIRKTTTGFVGINLIGNSIPDKFSLAQNYPNPFNPATKIRFEIPEAGFTELKVYDAAGREVKTIVSEELNMGVYEADFNAVSLPSGVYFYKLTSGGFTGTRKMILIK